MGQKKRQQTAIAPPVEVDSPHAAWIGAALLVVLCIVAYYNALEGPLIFDDIGPIARSGLIKLPLWQIWDDLPKTARPVLFYALAINYQLCGLDDPPVGFHVFNVAVHLVAALVLFDLIRRTLLLPALSKMYRALAPWVAFAVAAVWLLHPLQTQAVNYIVQRCESMMALFFLLTLYGLVRAAQANRAWPWYTVSVVACAIGMGCKEVMIAAPLVAVIYDRVFLSESFRRIVRGKWLVYTCMLLACFWLIERRAAAIRNHATVSQPTATSTDTASAATPRPASSPERNAEIKPRPQGTWVSPWEYGMTQAGVILHYLRLSLWPHPLCLDYWTWPVVREFRHAVIPGLLVVALVVASFVALWRWPPIGFLGVSFFLILAPTSSFLPIQDLVFEHRMYLPLAALMTLLVLAGFHLLQRWSVRAAWSPQVRRGMMCGALTVVLGTLMTMTIARNRDYQSQVAIWRSVVDVVPNNYRAWQQLGSAYLEEGRPAEAEQAFLQGAAINPRNPWIMSGLADIRLSQAKPREAALLMRQAVTLAPNDAVLRLNLGAILGNGFGQWPEAVEHFQKAIKINPMLVEARTNLGLALINTGRIEEGIAELNHALRLDGTNVDALGFMGYALMQKQQFDAAIEYLQRAVHVAPNSFAAHDRLAVAFESTERFDEAIAHWQRAAELADSQNRTDAANFFRHKIELAKSRASAPRWKPLPAFPSP